MTDKEALKLALEALIASRTFLKSDTPVEVWEMNTTAVNECVKALAQPEELRCER